MVVDIYIWAIDKIYSNTNEEIETLLWNVKFIKWIEWFVYSFFNFTNDISV